MEVDKKRPKGGLLHLFDWSGKSRKKLFSNNSEAASEESKCGKHAEASAKSHPHTVETIEGDMCKATLSNGGSCEYSSASSVTSDDGYGSRAPGVVARLMGLDSLPTSNVAELHSNVCLGSHSLGASQREMASNLWVYQSTDYTNPNMFDQISLNPYASRVHKAHARPIERFQTDILPPRSAKPIPITHHKLLSPIKSPGFVPSKNAAYIYEAAAKIIVASPQTSNKAKVPSFVSPSVPLKIRNLKDKMEAAHKASRPQRSNEHPPTNLMKVQHTNKTQSQSDYAPASRTHVNLGKNNSHGSRYKGKSVSIAVQAKVNIQSREKSALSNNRSPTRQKQKNDVRAKQFSKNQGELVRVVEKGNSVSRCNNVLRQNNQKQNCVPSKDGSASKPSLPNQKTKKPKSINETTGLSRTINKVNVSSESGSRMTSAVATDGTKELPLSRKKTVPKKKQSVYGNQPPEMRPSSNSSMKNDEWSIKCNVAIDGDINWDAVNMKTGTDVVSFTFTSPIKGSTLHSHSFNESREKNCSLVSDSSGDSDHLYVKNVASPGFNVIRGDALNIILEQKLRELTSKVESTNCNLIGEGTSASAVSSLQNSGLTLDMTKSSVELDKWLQLNLDEVKSSCSHDPVDDLRLGGEWKSQHSRVIEECDVMSNETREEFDCQTTSPVSSCEPSVTSRSCSDSRNSFNDVAQHSVSLHQEELGWICESKSPVEVGTELSDTASSISLRVEGRKHVNRTLSLTNLKDSTNWELDYVKILLQNAKLMFIEFALGQTQKVISPNTIDQLENENGAERDVEEDFNRKISQKLVFDCISECLDIKCQQLFAGTCKGWAKWATLFQRRGWLAEELYKEILGWKSMGDGDMMVDEVVEKDMNTQCGRWLDFDMEAYEEGIDIEKALFTSLVDELVSDFMLP